MTAPCDVASKYIIMGPTRWAVVTRATRGGGGGGGGGDDDSAAPESLQRLCTGAALALATGVVLLAPPPMPLDTALVGPSRHRHRPCSAPRLASRHCSAPPLAPPCFPRSSARVHWVMLAAASHWAE
jgi:hypothetical protein